ncbi:hypothetical protein PLESTB_000928800 [Pleodorina starrii]|uniref:Uncharacterized protein n=1 Tax=Pleodorina starrii TaxID=330485 RepID=A0A9W6BMP7_9CHLO|nr:hypothetical protein PLESTM_001556400 [Pleodorina starrii]GLC54992.1 hypothetical protein PLESTB_000928800 [Pleodorina starrii]GLC68443.1 hypothetical protein PLESTF_000692100 [Pleodorina starrii]
MSYTSYFRHANFSFPTGFWALVGGAFYLQHVTGRPFTGTKEISTAEYNATPLIYLQHPDRHPTAFPKVPHMTDVPPALDELHAKAHGKAHHH